MLEVPREMPGFLVIFTAALLSFLCSRRLASFANFLLACGVVLIGLFSINFGIMLIFLFIFSTGQHLFLPLNSSIGMELAKDGKIGKRLGQLNGAGNLFAIFGSLFVFIGFKYLNFNFKNSFVFASFGFLLASFFIILMNPNKPTSAKKKFVLRKEYILFYWLNILFGTRKQLFITFAPWVLVTVFHQKTQIVASLLTIAGVIGIFFKPILGHAIDKFGEKKILAGEALVLILICIGYGFSKNMFTEKIALFVSCACYVIDYLLMSVTMARATYLKKIAIKEEDITQTLTMGVSIDHIFSISIAVVSGFIWFKFGYQFVFLLGAFIALINFFSAMRIKIK